MRSKTNRRRVRGLAAACVVFLGATAAACDEGNDKESGVSQSNTARNKNQDALVKKQPAHTVKYSPGIDSKNKWIDTWGQEKGKLAYVYIQNANGEYGYFVLVGPPVSYCDSLVPPFTTTKVEAGDYHDDAIVPAPGMDGLYHSSTNCNVYYGTDGVSGKYVEFSIGTNQSYIMFSEPSSLPQYRTAQQMGDASLSAASKKSQD